MELSRGDAKAAASDDELGEHDPEREPPFDDECEAGFQCFEAEPELRTAS